MVENLTEDECNTAFMMMRTRLPDDAEIVILSSTGSRAFGWGGVRYDRDIRAMYVINRPYWDYCHIGKKGYDFNINNLENIFENMRYRWTHYEDLSNPFYLHPKFDFEGFMSFCSAGNVRGQRHTTQLELNRLRDFPQMRKALHCYRQLMTPLYFLETGKLEINCLTVNERYNMQEFLPMCDLYRARITKSDKLDWDKIWKELNWLQDQLTEALEGRDDVVDVDELKKWQDGVRESFGLLK